MNALRPENRSSLKRKYDSVATWLLPLAAQGQRKGPRIARTAVARCLLLLCMLIASNAPAETAVKCARPRGAPYNTLAEVIALIDTPASVLPEDRKLLQIAACHVNFPMDSVAIERLSKDARATPALIDALNQATFSKLTLEEAHAQAAELEHHIAAIGTSSSDLPFRTRIVFLEQSSYPDARALTYGHYYADGAQLTVTLGGEEYRFDHVAPKAAETLYKSWNQVKVTQPYTDDGKHKRTISLDSISQTGMPSVIIAALRDATREKEKENDLAEAAKSMERHDYDNAVLMYNFALSIDKTDPVALKGREVASAALAKQQLEIVNDFAKGEWVDHRNNLVWTLDDNGEDIKWKDAVKYCQNLHTGGSTGWRLPSLEELKFIYDPAVTSDTTLTKADFYYQDEQGRLQKVPKGSYAKVHISGGIVLSELFVWSAKVTGGGTAQVLNYGTGEVTSLGGSFKTFTRALCVRP